MSFPASAKLVPKNLAELRRQLKKFDSKRKSVADTAVKVELFRLRKELQGELRQGQVAGKPFRPLRVVSRGTRASRKPLARLAVAVRYNVQKVGDVSHMSVGFDGPRSSKSWRRIAHAVQDGGDYNPDSNLFGASLRRLWVRIGGDYIKGRGKGIAKFFFLRKETTRLQTPPRPIIEPFWADNETEALKNITSNFNRKLRGERI